MQHNTGNSSLTELQRRYEVALNRLTVATDDLEWEWWVGVVETCLAEMREHLASYDEAANRLDMAIETSLGEVV